MYPSHVKVLHVANKAIGSLGASGCMGFMMTARSIVATRCLSQCSVSFEYESGSDPIA